MATSAPIIISLALHDFTVAPNSAYSIAVHLECQGLYRLESITGDEMVLVMSDGSRETWTRAPAD
jgi:hypothetical protein